MKPVLVVHCLHQSKLCQGTKKDKNKSEKQEIMYVHTDYKFKNGFVGIWMLVGCKKIDILSQHMQLIHLTQHFCCKCFTSSTRGDKFPSVRTNIFDGGFQMYRAQHQYIRSHHNKDTSKKTLGAP